MDVELINNEINFNSIGKKILQIRENCGKSIKECARAIGSSTNRYKKIENSLIIPSLPELEVLSYFLSQPINFLLSNRQEDNDFKFSTPEEEKLEQLLDIRNKVVGTLLQIAREKMNLSLKDLSRSTSISTTWLKNYESGSVGVPIDKLNKLADALDINLSSFLDMNSPISIWQQEQKKIEIFLSLPEDIQDFILQEKNLEYIQFAKEMKTIGFDNLENLAESIRHILKSNN